MSLLSLIKDKYSIISIVGMSKNSGKTVALNHLLGEALEENIPVGITSIGRDGESIDLVSETEKPRIYVVEGTLIATATSLLTLGDANIEIIKVTDFRTPLGDVVIGRVKSAGYMEIAGPQSLKEIKMVSDMMLELGAKFVIIDGALDRKSSATPSISEATILSSGAIVSRDINKVIERTIHVANIFNLPPIEDKRAREVISDLMERNRIGIIDEELKAEIIDIETALGAGHIIGNHINDKSKYLVIPGSLVKNTLEDLISVTRKYKNIEIIINDGTKVFIEPKDWLRFMRIGLKIKVLHPINLIGITLNPYAPSGYFFEPREFLEKTKSYISTIPVMDLMLGGD